MAQSGTRDKVKTVNTLCNLCSAHCGLICTVEEGKITKVRGMPEHPLHTLCIKAQSIPEFVYSPDRVTTPLRKVNGEFKEISWDEALGLICDRLTDIKQRYGAKAVTVYQGNPLVLSHTEKVARRFCDLFGTPNFTSGAAFCFIARTVGYSLSFGGHIFPHFGAGNRCMITWGNNPTESAKLMANAIQATRKNGAKLIVVDPRVTSLAKEADIHAQIRPGTDCALALALINVIIAEGLYDKAFVEEWTVGFDELAEHVKDYSPEKVEQITGVPASTTRDIARMYATNKPATISLGVSVDHCTNGIQGIRAVATLVAITGNLDVAGGNVFSPELKQTSLRMEEKIAKDIPVGADYPLFSKFTRETSASPLTDIIITQKPYPVKALIIDGSNPVLTWPNTNKVMKAFEQLDLLVVIDPFMTATTRMADMVLPSATFMETEELRDYGKLHMIALANKVIEPVGDSMENWKIWAELGRRMGYAEYFPWENADQLFEYLLKRTNISLEQLKQNPGGIFYAKDGYERYRSNGFNTPSGKVEIYSETMAECGYDPIPTFHEPAESQVSRPELTSKYPLLLITGARVFPFQHSRHRNLPDLRKLAPDPLVEINSQTANKLGIMDGNLVQVESLRGSIQLKAKLTEDILPQVISVQHGWNEANANYLTDDESRDPVSGYPGYRSTLCRVTKV